MNMRREEIEKYLGRMVGVKLIHKPQDWVIGILTLDKESGCYVFPEYNIYFKDKSVVAIEVL